MQPYGTKIFKCRDHRIAKNNENINSLWGTQEKNMQAIRERKCLIICVREEIYI